MKNDIEYEPGSGLQALLEQLSEAAIFWQNKENSTLATLRTRINSITLKILSLEKRKEYLENNMPDDETITAWCADFTEDLTGEVGMAEAAGEAVAFNILPGDNAAYSATRDGQLVPTIAMSPAQAFYSIAMLPGWQKWMPTYRYGTITAIDGDTADVALETATSSAQAINVNQSATLTDVDIEYMSCNGAAFDVGDDVLVQFVGQDFESPKIIGFKSEPKPCSGYFAEIYYVDQYDRLWCGIIDFQTETFATLRDEDGDIVRQPFRCTSYWDAYHLIYRNGIKNYTKTIFTDVTRTDFTPRERGSPYETISVYDTNEVVGAWEELENTGIIPTYFPCQSPDHLGQSEVVRERYTNYQRTTENEIYRVLFSELYDASDPLGDLELTHDHADLPENLSADLFGFEHDGEQYSSYGYLSAYQNIAYNSEITEIASQKTYFSSSFIQGCDPLNVPLLDNPYGDDKRITVAYTQHLDEGHADVVCFPSDENEAALYDARVTKTLFAYDIESSTTVYANVPDNNIGTRSETSLCDITDMDGNVFTISYDLDSDPMQENDYSPSFWYPHRFKLYYAPNSIGLQTDDTHFFCYTDSATAAISVKNLSTDEYIVRAAKHYFSLNYATQQADGSFIRDINDVTKISYSDILTLFSGAIPWGEGEVDAIWIDEPAGDNFDTINIDTQLPWYSTDKEFQTTKGFSLYRLWSRG